MAVRFRGDRKPMRVGVFTPLLSQLPLAAVLKKLTALQITTVELATGNYPGDAHCKLSMLENPAALAEFKKVLADHGVTIAIEMHPGFVVYSPETMLRLRSIAGPSVGCNFDPSHLFWQSIDPVAAVRVLEGAIFHVHAKDTQVYPANLSRTGVLDTKPYTQERERSWIFRTCGYGHGAEWWSEFISTLRMFGYDSVLSIEHEDSLLSPEEGLTKAANFLNSIVIREEPGAAWWV